MNDFAVVVVLSLLQLKGVIKTKLCYHCGFDMSVPAFSFLSWSITVRLNTWQKKPFCLHYDFNKNEAKIHKRFFMSWNYKATVFFFKYLRLLLARYIAEHGYTIFFNQVWYFNKLFQIVLCRFLSNLFLTPCDSISAFTDLDLYV